jgi:hypothetical protein
MEVLAARFGLPSSSINSTDETLSSAGPTTAGETSASIAPADQPPKTHGAAIPTEEEQRHARELVKEMFLRRYKVAENDRDKQAIAEEMVAKSAQIGNDLPGKYVMLVTAQRIALEANDVATARSALDQLLSIFDVDPYDMQVKLLLKTDSISHSSSFDTQILDQAIKLLQEAVQRDDYATANALADVAMEAARRVNDAQSITKITKLKRNVDRVAASHKEVNAALARLAGPTQDPATSGLVGRHYCFMKDDWEKGIPHLARGGDPALRGLAQREMEAPDNAEKKLALADGWYEAAQKGKTSDKEAMLSRALMWYQAAQGDLPEGLAKLKAELRTTELLNFTRK